MKNIIQGLVLLVLLVSPVSADLPFVDVEVRNESDVFVSLTINSLCAPRIILKPGESMVVKKCLRKNLVYQGSVVFYTENEVLERHLISAAVRPNNPWIFCKLPKNKTHCD